MNHKPISEYINGKCTTRVRDTFCWYCHLKYEESGSECSNCARAYHQKCLSKEECGETAEEKATSIAFAQDSNCFECRKVLKARKIPQDQMNKYCQMLEHAVLCLKFSEVCFISNLEDVN